MYQMTELLDPFKSKSPKIDLNRVYRVANIAAGTHEHFLAPSSLPEVMAESITIDRGKWDFADMPFPQSLQSPVNIESRPEATIESGAKAAWGYLIH
jgi:hypothetical protein